MNVFRIFCFENIAALVTLSLSLFLVCTQFTAIVLLEVLEFALEKLVLVSKSALFYDIIEQRTRPIAISRVLTLKKRHTF